MTTKSKLCAYFQAQGHCKFGENCRYMHAQRPLSMETQNSDTRFSQLLLQRLNTLQKLKIFSQVEDTAIKSLKELLLMMASMIDNPIIQSRLRHLLLAKENQWTHLLEIFLQSFPKFKDKNSLQYGESFTYFLKASWRIRNRVVHLHQGESPDVYLLDVLGSLVPLVKRLIEIQSSQHLIDMDYSSDKHDDPFYSLAVADNYPTRPINSLESLPPGLLPTLSSTGLSVDDQTSRLSANNELRANNSQSETFKESDSLIADGKSQSQLNQDNKSSESFLASLFKLWSKPTASNDEPLKVQSLEEAASNQPLKQNTANETQSLSQTDYGKSDGKQAMQLYLEKFGVLIEVLERISETDLTALRSRVGIELRLADPLVFEKAGCENFKDYIALAQSHGIVSSIGAGSYARLKLNTNYSQHAPVQTNVFKAA